MDYNPRDIERKWQAEWRTKGTYRVSNHSDKPKFYVLDMFPYPSGAGLHVGHPLGYIASDIFSRYKRLKGFNVLHPMGYDSFGLPAEQYAIQTGTHPALTTEHNINRYRQQLENLAFSFDWSREVRTSDPKYYRWTQWIFMQLFNHYYDRTTDKALPITALVAHFEQHGNSNLNAVCDDDTPRFSAHEWASFSEKEQQLLLLKYRLTFPEESFVNWCPALGTVLSNDEVKDGVSERGGHPVERKLMKQWAMRITAYADRLLAGLDEIDWSDSIKEQQRNWIGRSVGASVRFAIAPPSPPSGGLGGAIEVFTTRVDTIYGVTFMVLAPEHELVPMLTTDAQRAEVEAYIRWAGSRSDVERMAEAKKVTGANTGAFAINPFNGERIPIFIADYVLANYGTGAVMAVPSGDQRDWNFAKHFSLPIVPILDAQKDLDTAADPTKEGRYINSSIINGMTYAEAVPTLINWLETNGLGRGKTQYKLRNAVFSRQRYWGEPVPAYWKDGVPYLIDESELPLVLPSIDKYLPTETGEPPLGRAEGWKYTPRPPEGGVLLPSSDGASAPPSGGGGGYEYELSTMPGWAGSSWYFYRYMDAANDREFVSREAVNYWQDVDLYLGGSEHAVGHLLYSRFWNHFLFDLGLVPKREFARKLINQGMIQGRSNFVFRARERFYEEYLKIKVLQPFFSELGPIEIAVPQHEEAIMYDFAFAANDLVIEVTSQEQEDKIQRIRQKAQADGKRLLVLFNEVLASAINEPEATAAVIRRALDSREDYLTNESDVCCKQLFISHNLTHKYGPDALTKLHVDVNIVENDVLDVGKARTKTMFESANFKLDADGKFTCSWEVEKMSKSKFNVVNPDDVCEQYGVDCFRMFEMFLGPIEDAKPWNTQGISGVSSFLRRFWGMFFDDKGQWAVTGGEPSRDELRVLHTCIKKVTDDVERFSMNTCVSHFMICTNDLKKLGTSRRAILEPLVVLIAPFAPHIAEELWHQLGHSTTVCDATYPVHNEEFLKTDSVIYPVQINGKHRGNIEIQNGTSNADIEAMVMAEEFVQRNLAGAAVKKFIVVPGRIVNIVA